MAEHVLCTEDGPSASPLHLACIRLLPGAPIPPSWMSACYGLTARVEPLAAAAALLDLRPCAEGEAPTLVRGALAQLDQLGAVACAGIGPSLAVAQLAAYTAAAQTPLVCVTAPELPRYLRTVPVGRLTQLRPQGLVSPEVVARLEHFGLRTLAALARLGEPALCRQFGARVGAFLAAVAAGRDVRLLQPSAPPVWHRARVRFDAAPPEAVLAAVPRIARQLASALQARGQVAQTLRVGLSWEDGHRQAGHYSLREGCNTPAPLQAALERLLQTLLAAATGALTELRLAVGDLAPRRPLQAAFCSPLDQRRARVYQAAEALSRRAGHALLHAAHATVPAAIFSEERYRLLPAEETGERVGGGSTRAPNVVSARDAWADAWHEVPQRLHWW